MSQKFHSNADGNDDLTMRNPENADVINGQTNITVARLLTLKQAVKLESLGMKRSGRGASAKSIAAKQLGLVGRVGYDTIIGAIEKEINKLQVGQAEMQKATATIN